MTTIIICECGWCFTPTEETRVELFDDEIDNHRCPRCEEVLRSVPLGE